jgi:FkbM family methyltransferase
MRQDPRLSEKRIEILELAVADREGEMEFFVFASPEDHGEDEIMYGSSSLCVRVSEEAQASRAGSVKVRTRRLDDVLREQCPEAQRIALWIDAEGAEWMILQGLKGIAEKVYAIHVETAERPLFKDQATYSKIADYLATFGFISLGNSITPEAGWGDAVFVKKAWADSLGFALTKIHLKSKLATALRVHALAVFLKRTSPPLYRVGRSLFLKAS